MFKNEVVQLEGVVRPWIFFVGAATREIDGPGASSQLEASDDRQEVER